MSSKFFKSNDEFLFVEGTSMLEKNNLREFFEVFDQ